VYVYACVCVCVPAELRVGLAAIGGDAAVVCARYDVTLMELPSDR
jgi:hypothetical protein